MRRVYQLLLGLYPTEYRRQFADEMLAVFAQTAEERRREGWFAYARFAMGECIGLLGGGFGEQRSRTSLAAPLGGIALAAALHSGFYVISSKILSATSIAVERSSAAAMDDPAKFVLLVAASLLWLLVSVLLSVRLMHRRR